MNYFEFDVTLQEVPGEISLCFSICGCPLKCEGCHSPFLFKKENGKELKEDTYQTILSRYRNYATCVLFMGGEWEKDELILRLQQARCLGYKTCLYTGLENVDIQLLNHLNWVKTGKWIPAKGGLDSVHTNQEFREVDTGKKMNSLFQKK